MNTSLQPSHVWRDSDMSILTGSGSAQEKLQSTPRWNIQNSDIFPKWQVRSHGSLTGHSFNLNYTNTANTSGTPVSAVATTAMVWSVQDSIMLLQQNQFWKSGTTENLMPYVCRRTQSGQTFVRVRGSSPSVPPFLRSPVPPFQDSRFPHQHVGLKPLSWAHHICWLRD